MQVPTAGVQPTALEQERMSHIRTQRALHHERIMGSQAALELLTMQETQLGDAINARMREDSEKAAAQMAQPTEIPPGDAPRGTLPEPANL